MVNNMLIFDKENNLFSTSTIFTNIICINCAILENLF